MEKKYEKYENPGSEGMAGAIAKNVEGVYLAAWDTGIAESREGICTAGEQASAAVISNRDGRRKAYAKGGMKRLTCFLWIALLCAGAAVLTGCSGGTGDMSDSQTASGQETAGVGETDTLTADETDGNMEDEYWLTTSEDSASVQFFAMDTYMTVTAYGDRAEEAVMAAMEEVSRLDALLSAEDEDGEIYLINHGQTEDLSEETVYLIERSLELYESTNGAFNIAIYPLTEAWGFTTGDYAVPDSETISSLLTLTDASWILLDTETNSVSFSVEGMEIGLGGIAKGYTSARIMDIFTEYGIESALVNLGGNVQALGSKTDGSSWRVGIQHPNNSSAYLGIVSVQNKAVITSGGYERYFEEDGVTYHHIIDPQTGYPAENGLISVSIISEDGTMADGLSTALFVMGLDDAISYWRAYSDAFDMILMDEDENLYISEGLADSFTSDYDYEIISYEE